MVAGRRDEASLGSATLRWCDLARAAGIDGDERLLVALSGGRDSVALLMLLAEAQPRPALLAVHVDHGWRGAEGASDAAACAALARELGVPIEVVRLDLSPRSPSAEAAARTGRLSALVAAARASGHHTVLTAHHQDDALEGLLLRWRRTGEPSGWLRPDHHTVVRGEWPGAAPRPNTNDRTPVFLVRPLAGEGRAAIDAFLAERRATCCEDASNSDRAHARNAVRHELVPLFERVGGAGVRASLARLGAATLALDEQLGALVPPLEQLPHVHLTRPNDRRHLGARCAAAPLAALVPGVREPVLQRLIVRTTGSAPRASVVAAIARDLGALRRGRHTVAGGWSATTDGEYVEVAPPDELLGPLPGAARFDGGDVELGDGRVVTRAAVWELLARRRALGCLEDRTAALWIRGATPGDRIQEALGRPVRALRRLLAELGIPPAERARVLVLANDAGLVLGLV